MVSFFSLTLSCLNAGARIMFSMGQHGFLHRRMHSVHPKNMTPHFALGVYGAVILTVAVVLHAFGTSPLTLFGDAGTLAAFGFLLAYFMITIAAPSYLRKLGELLPRNVLVAVAAFALLLVPPLGASTRAPPWPVNLFPYLFSPTCWPAVAGCTWSTAGSRERSSRCSGASRRHSKASAHQDALSEEQHRHHTGERMPQISAVPAG